MVHNCGSIIVLAVLYNSQIYINLYPALTAVEPHLGHFLSLCSLSQVIHENLIGLLL